MTQQPMVLQILRDPDSQAILSIASKDELGKNNAWEFKRSGLTNCIANATKR
jgi:hypothetical protein